MSKFEINDELFLNCVGVKELLGRIRNGLCNVKYSDIQLLGLGSSKEREFINYIADEYGVSIIHDETDYYSDDAVVQYINFIKDIPLLSDDEFKRYFYEYKHGSKDALDMLVVSNLRLVPFIAKNYYDDRLPFADLISAGNLGLYDALRKYVPSKGRFSTYAYEWISQKMNRAVASESRNVRFAYEAYYKFTKYSSFLIKYYSVNGCYPSDSVIMDEIGITYDTLEKFKMFYRDTVSFNTPVVDADEAYLEDFLWDKDALSVPDILYKKELVSAFDSILKGYSPRKEKIIKMRFGLDDGENKTLREVSETLGVTKEGVRSSQNRVLEKLKNSVEVKRLHPDYDREESSYEVSRRKNENSKFMDSVVSSVYNLDDITAEEICIIKALFSSGGPISVNKVMELEELSPYDDEVKLKLINDAIDKYLTLYKKGVKKYVRK